LDTTLPSSTKPRSIQDDAESVRAYLVEIRGGAPFLSAAVGRLLIRWLEDNISATAIMAAIDHVADGRRKKRGGGKPPRGRLTLVSCRRQVEKRASHPSQAPATDAIDLSDWCEALRAMEVPPALHTPRDALVRSVQSIAAAGDPDALARAATQACRAFHAAAWDAAQPEVEDLRTNATAELASLRTILDEAAFSQAVEAVARDHVRARYPLVSAKAVWDTLQAPLATRAPNG